MSCASSRASAAVRGTPLAAKGSSGAERRRVGHQRFHGSELLRERLAALDRAAQRDRHEGEPSGAVRACGHRNLSFDRFRRLLQRGHARRQRLQFGRRHGGRLRRCFLRKLEGRIGAALRIARGRACGIGALAQLRERPHRRFERRHARGERCIGLRGTRRCGRGFRLGDARIEIGEPAHRLLGSADARRKIRERTLIEAGRLRPVGEAAHLLFEDREPPRQHHGKVVARVERADAP